MAFSLKTWVNRISEYPNRRKLTHEDGSTELVTVARAEGQISAEGNAFSAEEMNDLENRIKGGFDEVNQSLTNIKKTYLRLVLPNVAADAKAVCDYINKNYLMGQITHMYSIEFDVVASNADWFSGVLSTDSNVDSNARTVWGIVQRRSISADNSTLYKYFGSGAGGAGTVSPFKRYEDGRTQGRNDVIGSPNSYGLYTKAQYDANKVTYKSGNYNTGLNGETWRSTSFNTGFSTIIALQINCWNDEGNGYFNAFKNVRISGGKVSLDFYAADYINNYVQWLAVGK